MLRLPDLKRSGYSNVLSKVTGNAKMPFPTFAESSIFDKVYKRFWEVFPHFHFCIFQTPNGVDIVTFWAMSLETRNCTFRLFQNHKIPTRFIRGFERCFSFPFLHFPDLKRSAYSTVLSTVTAHAKLNFPKIAVKLRFRDLKRSGYSNVLSKVAETRNWIFQLFQNRP